MAKAKNMPVKGGTRKARYTPSIANRGNDDALIKYNTLGSVVNTDTGGQASMRRLYIPGFSNSLIQSAGSAIVRNYACATFRPGTQLRWEPSVSFNTSGRVYVGFVDNPEMAANINDLYDAYNATPNVTTYAAYANQIKALGTVRSFPIWQETEIPFPTRTRRKMFDTNANVSGTPDVFDRSLQTAMFCAVEGSSAVSGGVGNFWYRDVVNVETIAGVLT